MANPRLPAVRDSVRTLTPSVVAMRRDLHSHPEVSWHENRTQQVILDALRALPLDDVRPIAKTGATAVVHGARPGPALLWRADIDALPVPERSGLPFASQEPSVMHACGHDAHMAIALGLAELLGASRNDLAGNVRFVFQPAEEAAGGAQACVAAGVLEAPHVERVLGLHISSNVPLGAINVAPGPFFAAPTFFKVVITGRGGHAAAPHQAVDAIVVAAHCITALQTVVSRSISPADDAVLTIGRLKAGYRSNVIAETAEMTGTIRSYTTAIRDQVLRRAEDVIRGVCSAFGATYTFEHSTSCPPVVNDNAVTDMVVDEARAFFGAERIFAAPTMGADDMSIFLEERPGCYFWLGAENAARGITGRHHDPGFMIDEQALPLGLEFGLRLIERSLRELAS